MFLNAKLNKSKDYSSNQPPVDFETHKGKKLNVSIRKCFELEKKI